MRTQRARHGRIRIFDYHHLIHMLKERLGMDVMIGMTKKPQWG